MIEALEGMQSSVSGRLMNDLEKLADDFDQARTAGDFEEAFVIADEAFQLVRAGQDEREKWSYFDYLQAKKTDLSEKIKKREIHGQQYISLKNMLVFCDRLLYEIHTLDLDRETVLRD